MKAVSRLCAGPLHFPVGRSGSNPAGHRDEGRFGYTGLLRGAPRFAFTITPHPPAEVFLWPLDRQMRGCAELYPSLRICPFTGGPSSITVLANVPRHNPVSGSFALITSAGAYQLARLGPAAKRASAGPVPASG